MFSVNVEVISGFSSSIMELILSLWIVMLVLLMLCLRRLCEARLIAIISAWSTVQKSCSGSENSVSSNPSLYNRRRAILEGAAAL